MLARALRCARKGGAAVISPCLPSLVLGALATKDHCRRTKMRKDATSRKVEVVCEERSETPTIENDNTAAQAALTQENLE